jgi:hypothetical protein
MKLLRLPILILSCVVIVVLFDSCIEDIQEIKKQAFEDYTGKWILISSNNPSDLVLSDTVWISLNSDSSFYSNSSVFLRNDSLRDQPIQGRWSVGFIFVSKYDPGQSGPSIRLSTDSFSNGWQLSGRGTKDSSMLWLEPHTYNVKYRWKLD